MLEKPLYTSIFASAIKSVTPVEKDKYLAIASLQELKKFLPEINVEDNIDLLPIACHATVVNRVNKNNDVIDTDTALRVYKWFNNKPINVEHDRHAIIGCVIKAGLSEFGTDKPLTEEEVKGTLKPFNITLGGVIWRVVNKKLAQLLEASNDPDSPDYMTISASWELGFSQYQIVGMDNGVKNIESSKLIISDPAEIEKAKPYLKAFGGSGKLNGLSIYRQPTFDALPLGISLTEEPAADVRGLVVQTMDTVINITAEGSTAAKEDKLENNTKNISQASTDNVKKDRTVMKLKSISDINDESWKELTASTVKDFLHEEIKKANEVYVSEKTTKETELKEAKAKFDGLETEHNKVKGELSKTQDTLTQVQASLAKIERENAEKAKVEVFSQRMSALDDTFELSKEDREVISASIKDLDEAGFKTYEKNMGILMKDKNKAVRTAALAKVQKEKEATEALASTTETAQKVVDAAVEGATKEKPTVPATSSGSQTLVEKYAKAFALDQVTITK